MLEEADQATILTVWVLEVRATIDNGCLQVIPGSHRSDLIDHCPTDNGMRIPDKLLPLRPPRPLPMTAGGVIFMNQRTVHSSLENTTDDEVRMSFDLRYQPTGQPTGRPAFPGFVARSSVQPQSVATDPAQWAKLWLDARERLANASSHTGSAAGTPIRPFVLNQLCCSGTTPCSCGDIARMMRRWQTECFSERK